MAIIAHRTLPTVLEHGAFNFEQYKSQFEEKLQDVTKQLNDRLDEMYPSLSVINDMTETEKFNEYRSLLQKYIDKLDVFDDYVQWINKEEILFKFPVSKYHVLESMKSFVKPFYTLMVKCIKWVRYYNVWMYGPFEYLEPKFVEQTAEDYLKEFQRTLKAFRNRIKLDAIENSLLQFRVSMRCYFNHYFQL